nr:hypothetical protein [uncultured bacterium]
MGLRRTIRTDRLDNDEFIVLGTNPTFNRLLKSKLGLIPTSVAKIPTQLQNGKRKMGQL